MNKSFDAVNWMRKRRVQIDREDEGLSWEERSRKTLELLQNDPLWQEMKDSLVSPERLRLLHWRVSSPRKPESPEH